MTFSSLSRSPRTSRSRWSLPEPTAWQRARSLAAVTLVTVLIWVWAEAETQRDDLLGVTPHGVAGSASQTTVGTLPLTLALGAGLESGWSAVLRQATLNGVRVIGPAESVLRVERGEVRLTGVVLLEGPAPSGPYAEAEGVVQVLPAGLGLRLESPLKVAVTLRRESTLN